jgi:hypothetical protein
MAVPDTPITTLTISQKKERKRVMRLREKLVPRFVNFVFLGSVLFSVLGCASVSVKSQRADATRGLRRKPQVLIVKDFNFPRQAEVRADRNGKELLAFEQRLQVSLREQLVRALGRYGIPVTFASTSQELRRLRKRQPAWLITGQFTRVRQGSRALRIVLGLGAGGTKMETITQVYDLSTRSRQTPLFTFSTSGGSNAEPGIITSVGPLAPTTVPAVVISVAAKGAHGVSEDAKRTARVIAAYVSEQLVARGYLPADKKAGRAKRPGEL